MELERSPLIACRRRVRACIQTTIEKVAITAVVQSRLSIDTQEISLTVGWLLIESIFAVADLSLDLRLIGTSEAEIACSIAIVHYIGPVTVICFRVECKTFGTFENVSASVHAVQKLIAANTQI